MPKISIVLPVYNGEKYLASSIESIINQTYQDWELIIVNDCSTDNSLIIAQNYSEQDKRIKIINNIQNFKLPQSLNVGFSSASGEYFTWTSDDNLYDRSALQVMLSYLERNDDVKMVYCDMEYIDEWDNIIGSNAEMCKNIYICNCVGACFLYKNEILDEIGQYDNEKFLIEDYDYWLRISSKYDIQRIPQCLYKYRYHSESMTNIMKNDIAKKVSELKLQYIDIIFEKLTEEELKKFSTGVLINNLGALNIIDKKMKEKNISYDYKKRFFNFKSIDKNKQFIIFGAGVVGKKAATVIGEENIAYFADNKKCGATINDISVISFDELKLIYHNYNLIIATGYVNAAEIVEQFELEGIENYSIFQLMEEL